MPRKIEIRLGQLLVQKQWCTLRQVTRALTLQETESRGEASKPLGQVLMGEGVIDERRLAAAFAELGVLVMNCARCGAQYSVTEYDSGERYACHQCAKPLSLGDPTRDARNLIPYHSSPGPGAGAPESSSSDAASPAPPAQPGAEMADPYFGKVFGGCKLLEKIAAGGMGVVYKAQQLNLNRIVAVKVLSKELSSDQSFVRRFIEEARSAAQLNHANIVHILDVGDYQGTFYFTMEYVDGVNLKNLLSEGKSLPIERAMEVALQVASALQHAHRRGIIHRDIKPENIMITREGVVKLADLGLAKRLGPSSGMEMTQAGSILGTPFYMAPEQAKDFSMVDGRSDIYSLGVTLFKTITGRVPFSGRTPLEVMIRVLEGQRPRLKELRQDVPPEVERIIDRMMERDPAARYQGVDGLIEDLRRVLKDQKEADRQLV